MADKYTLIVYIDKQLMHDSLNDRTGWGLYAPRMDTKKEAGRRIKQAREARGYTLKAVCDQLPGLTVSRLSNWETGLRMIGVDEAKKLAPVLGLSAADILTVEPSATRQNPAAYNIYSAEETQLIAFLRRRKIPADRVKKLIEDFAHLLKD